MSLFKKIISGICAGVLVLGLGTPVLALEDAIPISATLTGITITKDLPEMQMILPSNKSLSLEIIATGEGLSYQWYQKIGVNKEFEKIKDATKAILDVPELSTYVKAQKLHSVVEVLYHVEMKNAAGETVASRDARVTHHYQFFASCKYVWDYYTGDIVKEDQKLITSIAALTGVPIFLIGAVVFWPSFYLGELISLHATKEKTAITIQ